MSFGVMFRFPAPTSFYFRSRQAAPLPMRRARDALGCAAKMAALHAGGPQFIAADDGGGRGGRAVAQERAPPGKAVVATERDPPGERGM